MRFPVGADRDDVRVSRHAYNRSSRTPSQDISLIPCRPSSTPSLIFMHPPPPRPPRHRVSDCQDRYHHVSVCQMCFVAAICCRPSVGIRPRESKEDFDLTGWELNSERVGEDANYDEFKPGGGELPRFLQLIRRTELICWSRKSTRIKTLGKTFTPLN